MGGGVGVSVRRLGLICGAAFRVESPGVHGFPDAAARSQRACCSSCTPTLRCILWNHIIRQTSHILLLFMCPCHIYRLRGLWSFWLRVHRQSSRYQKFVIVWYRSRNKNIKLDRRNIACGGCLMYTYGPDNDIVPTMKELRRRYTRVSIEKLRLVPVPTVRILFDVLSKSTRSAFYQTAERIIGKRVRYLRLVQKIMVEKHLSSSRWVPGWSAIPSAFFRQRDSTWRETGLSIGRPNSTPRPRIGSHPVQDSRLRLRPNIPPNTPHLFRRSLFERIQNLATRCNPN